MAALCLLSLLFVFHMALFVSAFQGSSTCLYLVIETNLASTFLISAFFVASHCFVTCIAVSGYGMIPTHESESSLNGVRASPWARF